MRHILGRDDIPPNLLDRRTARRWVEDAGKTGRSLLKIIQEIPLYSRDSVEVLLMYRWDTEIYRLGTVWVPFRYHLGAVGIPLGYRNPRKKAGISPILLHKIGDNPSCYAP